MKPGIHPKLQRATITCVCGATYETLSTKSEIRVEICASCHPFFTGQRRVVDTEGRVEKFEQKYRRYREQQAQDAEAAESV